MNYHWNWLIFWADAPDGTGTYLHTLIRGAYWTLGVSALAWIIALVFGVIIGVLRTARVGWVERVCAGYVELFRNVPLLVQMFLWYFVFPEVVPQSLGNAIKQADPVWSTFWTATVCLGLFTSSRIAEQVRAGITALPRGQNMAGTALGLTRPQVYRYILLPMTVRIIMPPLTSEALNLIKNSSIAFTIGLLEITGAARSMQEFSFQIFESFTAATILYLIINLVVVVLMRLIEKWISVPGFIGTKR
ncbi:amino acid ABC transporter permease [uncultured Castellaniella sp.]|jgi:glutamate/aspartate transport system permease protein|uniref:amino acid ABC transporter permease n=1 Tax=uncultured Castellaniella sp. TaxID=647907 RepID=UPI00262D94A8|nr:amino acid ABC transporter permease [uncultured Castellaniella sp.]